MARLTTTEARRDLSAIVNRTAFGKERMILHRHGKDLVAIISIEDLRILEELEDVVDLEETRKALADPKNRKRIHWAKIRTSLRLRRED